MSGHPTPHPTAAAAATPNAAKAPGRPRRRGSSATMGVDLRATSTDGRRLAVAVLEVLAGARTPLQAAQAVGLSLPAYYKLEQRALEGLVYACEPRRPGRQCSPERELAKVQKEIQRLHHELQRQQALTRAAQRALGLAPPAPRVPSAAAAKGKDPGKRPRTRNRRPMVRALKAVRTLQEHVDTTPPEAPEPPVSPAPPQQQTPVPATATAGPAAAAR